MDIKVNIKNDSIEIPSEIISVTGGNKYLARIFYNRGFHEPEIIRQMLDSSLYEPTLSSEFPGMEVAVERICKALEKGEKIAVYGDYDVDGVTATAVMVENLRPLAKSLRYHVPDRFSEGYGMNGDIIEKMAAQGINLVITCDCGISNVGEVALANRLGMEVVVTDHHTLPEVLPPAISVINPKLLPEGHRARSISGCAMAYFLCLAVKQRLGAGNCDKSLDIVALSLIADVVSLTGESRYLLKKGMELLLTPERKGLKALYSVIEKKSKMRNEEDIAFQVAPRLNAAGRLDSARLSVELLICNEDAKAASVALQIDALNSDRKRIQEEIIKQAEEMAEKEYKTASVLVLYNPSWHHGIIGIAAGRICEKFGIPAILMSLKEDGTTVVGSARSTEAVNIYELLKLCEAYLLKFGGHGAAAGLSVEKERLEDFQRFIRGLSREKVEKVDEIIVDVDMALSGEEITEELYDNLKLAGPYGEGFEAPVFFSKEFLVQNDRVVGTGHHIMVLEDGEKTIRAVKWNGEEENYTGKKIDVIYTMGINSYNGKSELQLSIIHFTHAAQSKKEKRQIEIIDKRYADVNELFSELDLENSVFFYEGLDAYRPFNSNKNIEKIFFADRHSLKHCQTLVLLSLPTNFPLIREIVAIAKPNKIVLSFCCLPDYSLQGFIKRLLGYLKHLIEKNENKIGLEELSIRFCVEPPIIETALSLLMHKGFLSFTIEAKDEVMMNKSDNINTVNKEEALIHMTQKRLAGALSEKNAYLTFAQKIPIAEFNKIL